MNRFAMINMSISMIIFGSIGLFSRLSGLPAMELVFVRCISAAVFLSVYWLISGKYRKKSWIKSEALPIVGGGILLVLNWILFFASFEHTAISVAVPIYNLAPILVAIAGWLFFRERIRPFGLLAVLLAFVGAVFISGLRFNDFSGQFSAGGPVYALLAACFYASVILTGKYIKQTSPYLVTIVQTSIGILMLFPFVDYSLFTQLTVTNWFYCIITGIIHTGLVYLLFYSSIRLLPTVIISALTYLDPLVAILLDITILGFVPSWVQILGILLIFLALAYTFLKKEKA